MFVECPHCNQNIEIIAINCAIFRCGIYKHNFEQINPHLDKENCDKLKKEDKIYGCGKPFRLISNVVEKCDYI